MRFHLQKLALAPLLIGVSGLALADDWQTQVGEALGKTGSAASGGIYRFWPSWRTPSTTSSTIEVALRSSLTRTTVPSRIRRTIGSSASEREVQASQSDFTFRQTRLTGSLLTAPPNTAASARRTRRVLVPAEVGPNNRQWVPNDLTSLTGAPPLGSVPNAFQPAGLMHDLEFTLHVFYGRNEDRHLYELHFNDSGWHVNDLTGMTGTLGFDGPLAYVHLQQGTLNVNAISADGHIHAISREVGKDWNPANQLDLTVAAGGAPPASGQGGLVGFVFRDLTQHIFYIADNSPISHIGDIIELTDE